MYIANISQIFIIIEINMLTNNLRISVWTSRLSGVCILVTKKFLFDKKKSFFVPTQKSWAKKKKPNKKYEVLDFRVGILYLFFIWLPLKISSLNAIGSELFIINNKKFIFILFNICTKNDWITINEPIRMLADGNSLNLINFNIVRVVTRKKLFKLPYSFFN